MVGIHGVRSSSRPLVAARKATDRLGDQMTQARHAREKARVLRGFPDGRPHDDAASREAPDKGAAVRAGSRGLRGARRGISSALPAPLPFPGPSLALPRWSATGTVTLPHTRWVSSSGLVCPPPGQPAPRCRPRRTGKSGAYAPPALRQSNSGMPIALALSARLSVTPEPGNTTTPIGRASSSWSLRLNGAAF